MMTRRLVLPALPSEQALDATYAARLEAVAHPRGRGAGVWTGLLAAGMGFGGGVCLMTLVAAAPPPPTYLTPQQHQLQAIVLELAQAATSDDAAKLMTRLDQVVRRMHPPPRPHPDALLPTRVAPTP